MHEFFRSVRFRIFAVIGLVLIGLMLRTAVTGGFSSVTARVAGIVSAPAQRLSAAISGGVTDMISGVTSYAAVHKENEQLKKQISDLNSKMVDYNQMKNENEQYKNFLGLKQENSDYKFEPAMVISRDPGQWFSAFTIDKGSLSGILPNDPVITSEGLVGKVSSVSLTSSVVTTILDPAVSVGALISQTGDVGVAQGDRENATAGELKVSYISKDSNVAQGDLIISAGTGGIFPKNLKIGTVESVKTQSDGLSLYAVVKPMADPSTAKNVLVITDFTGKVTAGTTAGTTASAASSSSQASSKKGGK